MWKTNDLFSDMLGHLDPEHTTLSVIWSKFCLILLHRFDFSDLCTFLSRSAESGGWSSSLCCYIHYHWESASESLDHELAEISFEPHLANELPSLVHADVQVSLSSPDAHSTSKSICFHDEFSCRDQTEEFSQQLQHRRFLCLLLDILLKH